MKHDTIKTDNYLLVVDESEIKDVRPFIGKWHLEKGYILNKFPNYLTDLDECKIVIAHLPLNGSPILEGVELLPPLEEDGVEKLADKYANQFMDGRDAYYGYKEGYNKAKEKYKYTEEDMRKAMFLYSAWITGGTPSLRIAETAEERQEQIIQSLSQPKMPIGFECEMQKDYRYNDDGEPIGFKVHNSDKIKTTTTPEGHTQWVGTYIYG